jgi:ABC-type multidrug transport system fused ATPase/permease subunit
MAAGTPSLLVQILGVCRPLRAPLAMAFPLIALNRISGLAMPMATQFLVDHILVGRRADLLWLFLAATAGAALAQTGTMFGAQRIMARAHERLVAQLRSRVQAHVVALPLVVHESQKTGAIVSTIMIETESFSKLMTSGIGEISAALLGAVAAFVFLLRIEPVLACGALALILMHTILSQWVGRRVTARFREHGQARAQLVGRLTETLNGIRLVKAYHAEQHESAAFHVGVWDLCHKYLAATLRTDLHSAVSMCLTSVGTAGLLSVGASKVLSGSLTVGELMAFSATLVLLMAPINQAAVLVAKLPQGVAEAERTLALLSRPSEASASPHTVPMRRVRGAVRFEDVEFAYVPARPVLQDVSFEVEPGSVTAFVGPSGAGKSTLAALIASLYAPSRGRILVDGIDLATVSFASYRAQLGMVLQETFLFDGSILENVAFCHTTMSEARIIAACRAAHVDEFAERLPDGYHSVIGERGVRLSGGQRQRIAIARAILADPRILILDEPTSSLDLYSEDLVVSGLKRLMTSRTTFVISHRPSLVQTADRVFVISGGRLTTPARPWHEAFAHANDHEQ